MADAERFYFEIYDIYLDDQIMAGLVEVSGPYLDDAVIVEVTQEPTSQLINSALRKWSALHHSQGKTIPGSHGLHDLGQLRYAHRLGIRVPGCNLSENPDAPPPTDRAPRGRVKPSLVKQGRDGRVPRTEAGRRVKEIREQHRNEPKPPGWKNPYD